MKIEKFVLPIENQPKKEAIKMVKKCLAVTLAALIVIFNVVPAQAYTVLDVGVTVSASGTLTGSTVAFTATVVNQADGLGSTLVFPGPMSSSGLTNSTKALKISGGTNEVDARIIIVPTMTLSSLIRLWIRGRKLSVVPLNIPEAMEVAWLVLRVKGMLCR